MVKGETDVAPLKKPAGGETAMVKDEAGVEVPREVLWKRLHSKAYHNARNAAWAKGLPDEELTKASAAAVKTAKKQFANEYGI